MISYPFTQRRVHITAEQQYIFGCPMFADPAGQGNTVAVGQSVYHHSYRRQQQLVAAFVYRCLLNETGGAVRPVPVHNEL